MEIKIENLSYGGPGVGRVDGKVVFVEDGVPGDILGIRIVKEKRNYSRAVIETVTESSNKRTVPKCEYFTTCGGCNWQHVIYKTQLVEKQKIVADSLIRIGKLTDVKVDEITGSPSMYGYRNRVVLTVFHENSGYKLGFYEEGSDKNVSIRSCSIATAEINQVIRVLVKYFEEYKDLVFPFDKIYLLSSNKSVAVSFLNTGKEYKSDTEEAVESVVGFIEENLVGIELSHELEFDLAGYKFVTGPYVFNQANYEINEQIINTISEWIKPLKRETMLDLYCGIGNFSIVLSRYFKSVTGVDSNRDSIKLANRNLKLNNISNTSFFQDKCRKFLTSFEEKPDLLLLDPPRHGVKDLLGQINRIKPVSIIYISCNPTTLARDLGFLIRSGYSLSKIKPLDMFPHSYHIEVAALLELK